VWTDRYVGFLQPKRRGVHPTEVDLGEVGFDGEVERQSIVVNDAVATVVQFTGDTCIVTAHNTYLYSTQYTCRPSVFIGFSVGSIKILRRGRQLWLMYCRRGQRLHSDSCDVSVISEDSGITLSVGLHSFAPALDFDWHSHSDKISPQRYSENCIRRHSL